MADKNIGHFNEKIRERFRQMALGPNPCLPEVDKVKVLALIDQFSKAGLSQGEIGQAYQQTKLEVGLIDSWEKLGILSDNMQNLLDRKNRENPCKKLNRRKEVESLVDLIRPIPKQNFDKIDKDRKLGYISADALRQFRELRDQGQEQEQDQSKDDQKNVGRRRACRKPDGTIYRIPSSRQCKQGVEVPDTEDDDDDKRTGRGRRGGRKKSWDGQARHSIIQSLKGKLGGGGKLDIKPIGGGK